MAVWQYLEQFVTTSLTILVLAGLTVEGIRFFYRRIQTLRQGYPITTPYDRSSRYLYLIGSPAAMPGTWLSESTNVRTAPFSGKSGRLTLTDSALSPSSVFPPGTVPPFITLQAQAHPFQGWSPEAYDMLRRYPLHVSHGTRWWQTESPTHIVSPPSMVGHPFAKAEDIFMHKWEGGVQFWVLEIGGLLGNHAWKRVRFGYGRSDGKRLSMTEDKLAPAWLSAKWHTKTREERRPLMSPL